MSGCDLLFELRSLRPSDFSYKHEARHECVLLTAPFWPLDSATILKAAQETLVQFDCGNYKLDIPSLDTLILNVVQRPEARRCISFGPSFCIYAVRGASLKYVLRCWKYWIKVYRTNHLRCLFRRHHWA